MGGVSAGDYSAQAAQAAWQEIVDRLDAVGQRPQVDCIVPFEEVKRGFMRLDEGRWEKCWSVWPANTTGTVSDCSALDHPRRVSP